jgi:hypothetical protein
VRLPDLLRWMQVLNTLNEYFELKSYYGQDPNRLKADRFTAWASEIVAALPKLTDENFTALAKIGTFVQILKKELAKQQFIKKLNLHALAK